MIISEKARKVIIGDSENPLEALFDDIGVRRTKNRISNGIPIYFFRYIGLDPSESFQSEFRAFEQKLRISAAPWILCFDSLDKSITQQEVAQALEFWNQLEPWYQRDSKIESELFELPLRFDGVPFSWEQKRILVRILQLYDEIEQNRNGTMRKNLLTLLLVWNKRYLSNLKQQNNSVPKLIHYGTLKRNEAYFLIFASQSGYDVLHMNPEEDKELVRIDRMQRYSKQVQLINRGGVSSSSMPFSAAFLTFSKERNDEWSPHGSVQHAIDNNKGITVQTGPQNSFPSNNKSSITVVPTAPVESAVPVVKSYEELAALSASIVMVNIYKHDFFPAGNGSGVVIDNQGLILTNYHVVRDGGIFGVVFENDEREYITHKLIDFNEDSDLALLRIERSTVQVPILTQGNLKRGQQIVAIGSPLGLMNTISDGIIAGFRRMNEIEYIQITAPISPGSSGGALLDRSGRLIGITSAGFADGQNLNLAVPISELNKLRTQS